jgi:plasmid replication initiation protein
MGEDAKPVPLKHKVVKSNDMVEAHYRLSLNEQKIIYAMISRIRPDDADFKPYKFTIEEITEMLGVSGEYHAEIRKIAKGLLVKTLHIHNQEEQSYLDVCWLSASKYYYGKGYIELEFSPMLKPYLLQLKEKFTVLKLKNVMLLNSGYSIRIYELLKQYQRIGSREFTVDELKKILGITANEYKLYNHFKDRVLLTAQRELAAKTDIRFDFTEKKTGRAVTGLRFYVISRMTEVPTDAIEVESTVLDEHDLAVSKLSAYEQDLFKRLQATYKLSKKQAHEVVTTYLSREGRGYVEALLTYCYSYWQKAVKVDSQAFIGAVTWAAIRDGWQIEKPLFPEPDKPQKKEPPPMDSEEDIAEVKKMLKEWKKEVFKDS